MLSRNVNLEEFDTLRELLKDFTPVISRIDRKVDKIYKDIGNVDRIYKTIEGEHKGSTKWESNFTY